MVWVVTGASGFIGRSVVRRLLSVGLPVRAVVRNEQQAQALPDGCPWVPVGDIDGRTEWSVALQAASVIVHLAGRAHVLSRAGAGVPEAFRQVNVDGTRALVAAAVAAGAARMVHVSSIGVLGDRTSGVPLDDATRPDPQGPYASSKLEGEEVVAAQGAHMETVILRPPLVFGPGNPGNFLRLLRLVDSGVPVPFGAVKNRRSLIYVENLVTAIIAAGAVSRLAGGRYAVADEGTHSLSGLVGAIAHAMGRRDPLVPVPPAILGGVLRMVGCEALVASLLEDLEVDGRRLWRDAGVRPEVDFDEAMQRTVRWFQAERRR